ncbi:MAG: ATP-binding protein [Hyphomonadaceae bacterium]|nr:ATP-binding protein [Hyphomonadaceae bacterium]
MQYFVNHDWVERTAGEVFRSERARYYLLGVMALVTSAAAGLAFGAIWLGLALLVDETRRALNTQLSEMPEDAARWPRWSLDAARAAALATAPAIAWFGRSELGPTLAVLLLTTLMLQAALFERRGLRHSLISASPYAGLAVLFLFDGAASGDLADAAGAVLALAFSFCAALSVAHARTHAAREDEEIIRQLNAALNPGEAAAWEADFDRRTLVGADRLAAVLGRPVDYADVIERACFAVGADNALVRAAFAPQRGPFRRLAIEHDVIGADGARMRIRHEGVVRTAPDGEPLRLNMVSRRVLAAAEKIEATPLLAATTQALALQASVLRTLSNELPDAAPAPLAATASLSIADQTRLLAERMRMIDDMVEGLARARHESESANLAKSQFLANMSHELRTPLNAIIGYAEILQEDAEDAGDATTVQDLNRILVAAKHLLSLINEILDLSKIEAGRMDVTAAAFDPVNMIQELVETVRPIAEANGNVLSITGDLTGHTANTDSMKLRQCVLNLLSNASKFTRKGRIDVSFERRRLNNVEQMFISVRDTGIGMSSAHMARLFQPFVQADPSITQQYGGTGLGLTITRRLAQLLGGDVGVESTLGQGALFTLHVPMNFSDAAAALGAAAAVDARQGPEDAPLVIVIEDEEDARDLAARALTRAGFAVQGVGGGEAGLALARAKSPALVLLDIYLPDCSGWRVLQALKHDPKTQDIPVIVLSVNEDRAHAISLGAAEHIVKPIDRDALAAFVMRYARKRTSSAPATEPAPVTQLAQRQIG